MWSALSDNNTSYLKKWPNSALAMGSQVCAGDGALGQPKRHKHLHMPMTIQESMQLGRTCP
jgi:hypothetical protein